MPWYDFLFKNKTVVNVNSPSANGEKKHWRQVISDTRDIVIENRSDIKVIRKSVQTIHIKTYIAGALAVAALLVHFVWPGKH